MNGDQFEDKYNDDDNNNESFGENELQFPLDKEEDAGFGAFGDKTSDFNSKQSSQHSELKNGFFDNKDSSVFAIDDETKQNMEEKHTEDWVGAKNLFGFHSNNGNSNSFMAYSFNNGETGGKVSNE